MVETSGLRKEQYISIGGGGSYRYVPSSENLKVIERFTRTGPRAILYEFTVEDPEIFTQSWRGQVPLNAIDSPLYEYACHEGNYALPGILAGARGSAAAQAVNASDAAAASLPDPAPQLIPSMPEWRNW